MKATADDLLVRRDIKERFGERLRQLRKAKGWTQEEMAEILGLGRSYLAEIERGKRNPSLVNLEIMALGFNLSLARLFSRISNNK